VFLLPNGIGGEIVLWLLPANAAPGQEQTVKFANIYFDTIACLRSASIEIAGSKADQAPLRLHRERFLWFDNAIERPL